jgi:hypothetical protein
MYVFILGVDHRIQWIPTSSGPEWSSKIEEFIDEIQAQCKSRNIELVAEEFSEYSLKSSNALDSTARGAAADLGVLHLFCDPDPNERQLLNIETADDREAEWLRRLVSSGKTRILFICGDNHVDAFASKLTTSGHKVETVGRGWGKGWHSIN